VSLPLSRTQIDKLGQRWASSDELGEDDDASLNAILVSHAEILSSIEPRVRPLFGGRIAARVKTRGTTLDKLQRGLKLGSIQDLAGMRLIGDFGRSGQDQLVADLVELFADEKKTPRVTDRRLDPRSGYRAVHVVVFPNGIPVEIQVRTQWQHDWADFYERLGDRFGRAIRYGGHPDPFPAGAMGERLEAITGHAFQQRVDLVKFAREAADRIAEREIALAGQPDHPDRAKFEFDTANTMSFLWRRLNLLDSVVPPPAPSE
jgi:hypothetical protein